MRRDPNRPDIETDTSVLILDLEHAETAGDSDLIILMLDGQVVEHSLEKELARVWLNSGKHLLVFINQPSIPEGSTSLALQPTWKTRYTVIGPVNDRRFLVDKFVPLVIQLLSQKLLGLGRDFPLFRIAIARQLISDTNLSNASYAFATGLGEIVPLFSIPLTVTDMIVLTKDQAFLAYKLGLTFGFSTRWQDYMAEFSGVLGTGFVFRQIARTLIGLVPGFGIIPKVGVAYAGTAVVGNAILNWYLTGRHISKGQVSALYEQTYTSGKNIIHIMRPRLPRRSESKPQHVSKPVKRSKYGCPQCGKRNARKASFCQYCGGKLDHISLEKGELNE
jgi:uncharacterized protein (DUF697 family)